MSVLREAIIYNMGTVQRITKCWWMGSFGHRGVTHHHFVLRFLTNLNGYRKREAANGHAGCSFKRCSEVHFIPKVMTIHWETMTSVMAVFSRWVGRETELENELIMREREREREKERERSQNVSEGMWRCNNSMGYGSVPVKIHGKLENICLSKYIVCAYDYLSPSLFACEYLIISRRVKHVF